MAFFSLILHYLKTKSPKYCYFLNKAIIIINLELCMGGQGSRHEGRGHGMGHRAVHRRRTYPMGKWGGGREGEGWWTPTPPHWVANGWTTDRTEKTLGCQENGSFC